MRGQKKKKKRSGRVDVRGLTAHQCGLTQQTEREDREEDPGKAGHGLHP